MERKDCPKLNTIKFDISLIALTSTEGTKIIGICVGTLDDKEGPKAICFKGITPQLAKKIVFKTTVSSFSFTDSEKADYSTDESIIPIQEEDIITFTQFFTIKKIAVRGKEKRFSISLLFKRDNRLVVYQEASYLSAFIANLKQNMRKSYISDDEFSQEFLRDFELLMDESIKFGILEDSQLKSKVQIICPICHNKNQVSVPKLIAGLKLAEHRIFEGDVCSHQFTVYIDAKLNVLGYKNIDVELKDIKDKIGNLKTPYDSIFEVVKN